ncbi:hypothetical protein HYC85_008167 [Camellia sinensis]|uniref:Uncharacterized protein n=1 Tax=Camellia sinensis TaxID=4442 RepID=A0A7J7HSU2_CAMSI|nr:hypothetical protein HYC85_008167 [Camellia sinensis]
MEPSDISLSFSDPVASSSGIHTDNTESFHFFPNRPQSSLKPLPLLSCLLRSPETKSDENKACHEDDEDITVALHIGLPNCTIDGFVNSSEKKEDKFHKIVKIATRNGVNFCLH